MFYNLVNANFAEHFFQEPKVALTKELVYQQSKNDRMFDP